MTKRRVAWIVAAILAWSGSPARCGARSPADAFVLTAAGAGAGQPRAAPGVSGRDRGRRDGPIADGASICASRSAPPRWARALPPPLRRAACRSTRPSAASCSSRRQCRGEQHQADPAEISPNVSVGRGSASARGIAGRLVAAGTRPTWRPAGLSLQGRRQGHRAEGGRCQCGDRKATGSSITVSLISLTRTVALYLGLLLLAFILLVELRLPIPAGASGCWPALPTRVPSA